MQIPDKPKKALLTLALLVGVIATAIEVIKLRRPPRRDDVSEPFRGIRYERQVRTTPRPLMLHVVQIDLRAPGVGFLVTPGDVTRGLEIPARTTSTFAQEFGVQMAINGGFSRPFRVGTFWWDYYPHQGDPVDVTGLAISSGETYSGADEDMPVLCLAVGSASIRPFDCPAGTQQALAGNRILVTDGHSVAQQGGKLHPRTAVGIDVTGSLLWWVVVDGRQRNYSEGVMLEELASIMIEVGADSALNLDGGGSSTLVVLKDGRERTLNAPMHKGIPMWERPVANHLGVYAHPR